MALVMQCDKCSDIFQDFHLTRHKGWGLEITGGGKKLLCKNCSLIEAQEIIYHCKTGAE